jgi:hypothetical protein
MAEHADQTFYRSPAAAIAAPPEQLAYATNVTGHTTSRPG